MSYQVLDGETSTGIVLANDTMEVSSGGTAVSTTVDAGGSLTVSSEGTANSTTVNVNGRLYVSSGGTANSTTVNSYGYLIVRIGGTALNIVENGGYVGVGVGANVTFASNSFSGLVLSSASATVHSGTTATDTTVNSRGNLTVFGGGTAVSTTVNSAGSMYVSSGGTALNIVENGGYVSFDEGANVTFTPNSFSGLVLSCKDVVIHSGTTANSTYVGEDGILVVSSGGTANNTIISGSGDDFSYYCGYMYVRDGGTVNNTSVNGGGILVVSSGGTVNSTIVSCGNMYVNSGGAANSTTVNSGYLDVYGVANSTTVNSGHLGVNSGGTVNSTTVNFCGYLTVLSGGTADSTTVNSGYLNVCRGGVANSTTVNGYGNLTVSSGGTASIAFNPWQGTVISNAAATVTYLERVANVYYGNNSSGIIAKGNVLSDLVLENEDSIHIYDGGTADNTTVSSGGQVHVSAGGKHAGLLQIEDGGVVSVEEGGVVDFTVAGRTTGAGYLINDLSLITGTPTYTITVSSYLAAGTYKLAQGAAAFTGTITIGTNEENYGDLTINGDVLSANTMGYQLLQSEGDLTLQISDVTAPVLGEITASTTEPTNQAVVLTVTATDNVAVDFIEYSLNGTDWNVYGDGVAVDSNRTVYFRATDTTGNISNVASYVVNNIDKVAPDAPTASASVTTATNQNVTVTAVFSEDSVTRQYSLDGETWSAYTEGIVFSDNGTVYFRGMDAVGNISNVTSYAVSNIDKVAPAKPTVKASTTAATNKNVTLTATFSADSTKKQYSTDNKTWKTYSSAVSVAANGTYYFRGIDAAGNISTVTSYKVTNIDKTAPSKPTVKASTTAATNKNITLTATFSADSSKKQYSTDNATWKTYSSAVSVGANGTYYFRGIDAAGNISTVTSYKVSNIDKVAPAKPTVKASATAVTNKNITLTATFSTDSAKKQYSKDNKNWMTYSKALTVTANATYYFRGLDAAGNISTVTSYKVSNIDKVAPAKPTVKASTTAATNKNITLTATFSTDSTKKQYSKDNKNWLTYSKALTVTANATYYFRGLDAAGNISAVTTCKVSNIDKTAPAKPTVTVSTTAMTNKSVTVKATFSTDSAKKQYSTDNKTWKTYSSALTVKANATYYFRGIDKAGNISSVVSKKISNICPKGDFTNDTLAAAKAKTALNLSSAKKITGWVGLGDPKDFIKLEVVKKGKVSLDMNAATAKAQKAGEVKLSLLNSAGKAVAVSALDSDTLATKSKVTAGVYYLGVTCSDVKKYSTDYTITAGMLAS